MCKYLFLIYLFTIVFLTSCDSFSEYYGNENKDTAYIKKWRYDDGNLKKVQEYNKDSVENGVYLFYYPSGKLKDSARIAKGKFQGIRCLYYENGELEIKSMYINGSYRWANFYREDGTLEFYKAYNYFQDLMFVSAYDTIGEFKRCEGHPIYTYFYKNTILIGEEFDIELLVSKPPKSIAKVVVKELDLINKKINSTANYAPDSLNRVKYSKKRNDDSEINILNIATIKNEVGKLLMVDSLIINIDKNGNSTFSRNIAWQNP